jgi:hypothetical protein
MNGPVPALRRLNFLELIHYNLSNPSAYSFTDYKAQGFRHPDVLGYCTLCDSAGAHRAKDASGFALANMSHGAHSTDFLDALDTPHTIRRWHDAGVLFVFEAPSKNYGNLYQSVRSGNHNKRPPRRWYWVHGTHPCRGYPDSFKGGVYGELIRSIILTFRLSNAYVTNLIKRGMNDPSGDRFKGVDAFPDACIKTCYDRFLSREIQELQPRVIFAFGSKVEHRLMYLGAGARGTHPTASPSRPPTPGLPQ